MDKVLTKMGSPCSPRWDDDWIAAVDAAESNAGRRICGARTLAGTPCRLESNHENAAFAPRTLTRAVAFGHSAGRLGDKEAL